MTTNTNPEIGRDFEDKFNFTIEENQRLHFAFVAGHARHLADLHSHLDTFRKTKQPFPYGQHEVQEARATAKVWNELADRIERVIADQAAKANKPRRAKGGRP
jgi:hypothetical protein